MRRELLAIMLASLAFSLWGYVWYATLFDDLWQALIGRTETDLINLAIARGPVQDVFVLVISVVQAIGIWLVLKWSRATSFTDYIGTGVLLATLIVLPALGNTTLFVGTPVKLLVLDYVHFLLGYAGMAFVFFLIAPQRKRLRQDAKA